MPVMSADLLFCKVKNSRSGYCCIWLEKISFSLWRFTMKPRYIAAVIAVSSLIGTSTFAADEKLSTDDKEFFNKTAQAGMTEVKLGNIAKEKTKNAEVKDFAEKMVTDHTKNNESLKKLAESKGVELPKDLDAKHQKVVNDLKAKSGTDFDKAYSALMVEDHEKVRDCLDKKASQGHADLKKWAKDTLPTIKHHLDMAKSMDVKIR